MRCFDATRRVNGGRNTGVEAGQGIDGEHRLELGYRERRHAQAAPRCSKMEHVGTLNLRTAGLSYERIDWYRCGTTEIEFREPVEVLASH